MINGNDKNTPIEDSFLEEVLQKEEENIDGLEIGEDNLSPAKIESPEDIVNMGDKETDTIEKAAPMKLEENIIEDDTLIIDDSDNNLEGKTNQPDPKSLLAGFLSEEDPTDVFNISLDVPEEISKMEEHQREKEKREAEALAKKMTSEIILEEIIEIIPDEDEDEYEQKDVEDPTQIKKDNSIKKSADKKQRMPKNKTPKTKKSMKNKDASDDGGVNHNTPKSKKGIKQIILTGLIFLIVAGISVLGFVFWRSQSDKKQEKPQETLAIVDSEENIEDPIVEEEVEDVEEPEEEDIEEETSNFDMGETSFGKINQIVGNNVIIQEENTLTVYTVSDEIKKILQELDLDTEINFIFNDEGENKEIIEILKSGISIDENSDQDSDDMLIEVETDGEDDTIESTTTISNSSEFEEAFNTDFADELESIRKREVEDSLKEIEDQELKLKQEAVDQTTIETLQFPMQSKGSGPLWFRFAWKPNDTTKEIAAIDDVYVELKTNNGTLITPENAEKYGRYWVDKGIVNFAVKNGSQGDWTFLVTKNKGDKLGEIGANITPISGFINIQKFSVKANPGKLLAIWKADGVKDDELSVEIFAKKGENQALLYSSNSVDSALHLIDKAEISTAKIAKGTYDIVIKIQDIDAGKDPSGKKIITAKHITDTYTIKNVDIY